LFGPNSTGTPVEAETPLPFGPRNCNQSSAEEIGIGAIADTMISAVKRRSRFLIFMVVIRRKIDLGIGGDRERFYLKEFVLERVMREFRKFGSSFEDLCCGGSRFFFG
jgi:hypothetical protein